MVFSVILVALAASATAEPVITRNQGVLKGLFGPKTNSCAGSTRQSCKDGETDGTCCFEAPGGLLMQSQFWDINPATGPEDSWTIQGLFSDNCDGTFDSHCDPSRAYRDITSLLSNAGENATLDYMKDYWQDIRGDHERFWQREWEVHGTCMSTFKAECFPGPRGSEAVAYFKTIVSLFKTLPTYDFLRGAGIEPSSSKKYRLSDIQAALREGVGGFDVQVSCKGPQLRTVAYYFNLIGGPTDGKWVPVDAMEKGHCPSNVSYSPKVF
ncbi:ribonuclease T2-like protein [Flagelloscypha sp. PMI_526]|nr:ribonuclease T2-like protein [Flagelloscypha sp. PMI_526]